MPESTTPPVNPFKKTTSAANRASLFALIAIILGALAIGMAWLSWKETHNIAAQVHAYSSNFSQQADRARQTMERTISDFQTKLGGFENKMGHLQNRLNQISNISVKTHNQRALSEAAYLIHMANLQLVMNHNVDAALPLMVLAHEQLKGATSPNVVSLKHSVAKAIVHLEKAPRLDINKLLAQLDRLKTDVINLPSIPTEPTKAPPKDIHTTKTTPWYSKLGQSLGSLHQLIIIRREKDPIKPLLTPQQLMFLKQNVQLKISEAEWAVLYQNTTLYEKSLADAKRMLETFYPNPNMIIEITKDIDGLAKINIKPKVPDLSETLKTLTMTSIHTTALSFTHIPQGDARTQQ